MMGLALFTLLTLLSSWIVAMTLHLLEPSGTVGTRLLTSALLYAVTMGWQPLIATWVIRSWVDPPGYIDIGLRSSERRFNVVAACGAIGLVAAAMFVSWALGGTSRTLASPLEPSGASSLANVALLLFSLWGTIVLVWVQAFGEEVGWRGYFLHRAMERFGSWPGLLIHGAVWGLWYAPVLLIASSAEGSDPLHRVLGVVTTCVLMGTLLGWLRLVSRSLAPAVVANTTVTLGAGLPYLVNGIDAGSRSAVFGPAGWLILLVAIASLLMTPWRNAVQLPHWSA